ncbi:PREDICTED: transmembrane protein 185B-like [Priapulus caudatus]|uniref:Transmembrane protein 185B-like n=2 Tax=Priapulus caudatus TaxID=37621 RepID=A0ABM1F721_PRICU|nr:PREDICTED: transmembrane protein 185B-like [Priapulus caudatus]
MMISVALHVILLMFEMLVCNKLENVHDARQPLWTLVFIPLVFVSIIAIAVCIWGFRHDRAFEMELFSSVNILQFIFIPLRLDEIIGWSWVVILIPTWIVLSVALIGVLYAVILAIVLLKSPDIIPEQRRGNVYSAVTYTMLVIPLLVWLVSVLYVHTDGW